MKKSSKDNGTPSSQGTLPKLKSQPVGPGTMPNGFTQGDAFFNPETTPAPFTNLQPMESAPEGPHPLLNSKIAKDTRPGTSVKPMPKLVPPPPPVIPNQTALNFTPQKPAVVNPPKLVPPPPPVAFAPSPPPIPAPAPAEESPAPEDVPYQYPEAEDEDQDLDEAPDPEPPAELVEETFPPPISPPEPGRPLPDAKPSSQVQSRNYLGQLFKQCKGIVELPLALTAADFCGSLLVPVEAGHSVVLLLLAKQVETGGRAVKITADGIRPERKDPDLLTALQAEVGHMTAAAAGLQGDIATGGLLIGQITAFLSGSSLKVLAPRAPIEAVRGPKGAIMGYFQGESMVQFVVSVVLLADGPVTHYLDLPFPTLLDGGVETYLLPNSTDVGDFVRYLSAKNSVGWRGQKTRTVRHRVLEKQGAVGRTLTWGGSAVVAYTFAAGLLGSFFPEMALSLSLLAPTILGTVLVATAQLWHKARRDMEALQLALTHRTSWRLVNFARDHVGRTVAQLQGAHKRQFIGEMCPQDALDTITKLGKTPPPELAQDPRLHEGVTAAGSYALGPATGADGKYLMDALTHAVSEVRHGRAGGAAQLVLAATKARMQAIVTQAGHVPSKELNHAMPLDVLFSASISKAKFPLPTQISVPLLDLERAVTAGGPTTHDCLMKAIAAAMSLVEHTEHFWPKTKPTPVSVKEIPYPKAGVPVVGEDFDNAFG